MRYQPVWDNGKTVGASRRDAEGRYNAIAGYLEGLDRFRALDLGAHSGYFSMRLAEEFSAQVTAVDDAAELREAASRGIPGLTCVHERVSPESLRALGPFDVTLCLSVLHHVTWWRSMVKMLHGQSEILFVEIPDPREDLPGAVAHSSEIGTVVNMLGGQKIFECPGYDARYVRPLYVVDSRR